MVLVPSEGDRFHFDPNLWFHFPHHPIRIAGENKSPNFRDEVKVEILGA